MNDYTEHNSWNKWLLNNNKEKVTFKANDYKGFFLSTQPILLPDLSPTGRNIFKGWFTDTNYSDMLSSFETSEK